MLTKLTCQHNTHSAPGRLLPRGGGHAIAQAPAAAAAVAYTGDNVAGGGPAKHVRQVVPTLWWSSGHGGGDVDHHVYLAELLVLLDRLDQGRHARVGVAMHFTAERVRHGLELGSAAPWTLSVSRRVGARDGPWRALLMDMRPEQPEILSSSPVWNASVPVPFWCWELKGDEVCFVASHSRSSGSVGNFRRAPKMPPGLAPYGVGICLPLTNQRARNDRNKAGRPATSDRQTSRPSTFSTPPPRQARAHLCCPRAASDRAAAPGDLVVP